MKRMLPALVGIVATLLLLTGPAAAAASPAFVVALNEDGSADLTVTYVYDLESDAEQQAFQELENNESAREAFVTRFDDRLSGVAQETAAETNRSMSVTGTGIVLTSADSTGVVNLTATWNGLAAVEDGQLVVGEPFASGFDPEQPLVVEVPEGYDVDATPSPDERDGNRLVWNAGTDLTGFELTASQGGGLFSLGSGPGFTAVSTLVGVLLGLLVARRVR